MQGIVLFTSVAKTKTRCRLWLWLTNTDRELLRGRFVVLFFFFFSFFFFPPRPALSSRPSLLERQTQMLCWTVSLDRWQGLGDGTQKGRGHRRGWTASSTVCADTVAINKLLCVDDCPSSVSRGAGLQRLWPTPPLLVAILVPSHYCSSLEAWYVLLRSFQQQQTNGLRAHAAAGSGNKLLARRTRCQSSSADHQGSISKSFHRVTISPATNMPLPLHTSPSSCMNRSLPPLLRRLAASQTATQMPVYSPFPPLPLLISRMNRYSPVDPSTSAPSNMSMDRAGLAALQRRDCLFTATLGLAACCIISNRVEQAAVAAAAAAAVCRRYGRGRAVYARRFLRGVPWRSNPPIMRLTV
ncbi:hypothetical protein IWX90DRAFT_159999 [Phyllosticta citrichinensis]|uniref:Uncharacterized protein n=1 Tax=Phyllosticta citrichinensis TaxID=1130410 RepID=A0ABR1Y0C9_9PEZI